MKNTILLLIVAFSVVSCNLKMNTNAGDAAGMIDDVMIIMEEDSWRTEFGDTVRYYFQQPYEVLPQYEPTFTINYIKPEYFTDLLQSVRNVIIVGSVKKDRTTKLALSIFGKENIDFKRQIAIKRNVFAQGQQITYLYGKSQKDLINFLDKNDKEIINKIAKNDESKIRANIFQGGEAVLISKKLKEKHDVTFKVPKGYRIVKDEENFTWIRYDEADFTNNLFFSNDKGIKGNNYGIAKRNELGEKYVQGSSKGSFMVTETIMDIVQSETKIDNADVVKSKGLWKLNKDFLGGPFINYLFKDKNKQETLVIDAFVKAPGKKKRQKMRELEYLLNQAKFN